MKKPFALTQPAKSLAPVAFAIALAGCSMAPKYDRPPAPIDIVYPSGAAYAEPAKATPEAPVTDAADIGWRDFFRDPLLQQLIGIALERASPAAWASRSRRPQRPGWLGRSFGVHGVSVRADEAEEPPV